MKNKEKIKKLIIFLIRRRLGLKKYEKFRFVGQASPYNYYYFTDTKIMKVWHRQGDYESESKVSLNWLLNNNCRIKPV